MIVMYRIVLQQLSVDIKLKNYKTGIYIREKITVIHDFFSRAENRF